MKFSHSKYWIGGLVSVGLWLVIFSSGVLISSEPYREKLANSEEVVKNFFLAMFFYTPTNAAILSCLSGLIGGCASNLVWRTDCQIEQGNTKLGAKDSRLRRQHVCMSENPCISLFRGFVVYLAFLAGIFVAVDNPFESTTSGQFMRYAGFMSLVAFGIGYDPTRFESLISNIPTIGGNEKQ